jgi:hypothetical protein
MTSQIMEEWLTAFNGRMKKQNWHVLLFLDNATCHPHIKLSDVRLAWFPPNTTSVSQPMDQGIIRKRKLALADKFSGPVRFRLRQVLL